MANPQDRKVEKEVAYELLLTLLEHQFSSPVQWIHTQDALLDAKHAQRYVEIGPSDVLRSMLRKTLKQKIADGTVTDAPECITFQEEWEELNKQPEDDPQEDSVITKDVDMSETKSVKTEELIPPAALEKEDVVPRIRKPVEIEDVPASAMEALLAIVAAGLRTPKANIDRSQSIRFLAKGRSALQNELIGNLAMEFDKLPDAAEDTPLIELGQELQRTFNGKLGKYLNEWLGKKISEKLAPGFTLSKLRSHLAESFCLKQGRQNSFFLTIEFDEVQSRLADDRDSWNTINRWAHSYMQERGLNHILDQDRPEDPMPSRAPQDAASSAQFAKFGQDLSDLMARHFKTGSHQIPQGKSNLQQPDGLVDQNFEQLMGELGPEFISGVRPYFNPEMVYKYQSSWNWAVQDLYVTLSTVLTRERTMNGKELLDLINGEVQRLRMRMTSRMRRCTEFLLGEWERNPEAKHREHCLLLLRGLLAEDSNLSPRSRSSGRTVPHTVVTQNGDIICEEVPVTELNGIIERSTLASDSSGDCVNSSTTSSTIGDSNTSASPSWSVVQKPTKVCTKDQTGCSWEINLELTNILHKAEGQLKSSGEHPGTGAVLIIGAGRQSISFVLVRQLLEAGSRVALCTSRLTLETRKLYSHLYADVSKPGAELVLLPFNQGSVQDISKLVNYIHTDLGWEIDHLIPFAAIPETGRTLEDLNSQSELAHRIMLTNTLRLIGSIVRSKSQRKVLNHSTQVILPLSPNHGQIGGDGLYAESKLALEALVNKWSAESWSDAVSLCAVRIGWTRGTGLMASNDILAEGVEKLGVRTFTAEEMAALLTLVMAPDLLEACSLQPILCDFSGGMGAIPDIRERMELIRTSLLTKASVQKRLNEEATHDWAISKTSAAKDNPIAPRELRAKQRQQFPVIPERYDEIVSQDTLKLRGLVDLDSVVVITGFAEIGSAGSSRTRWELEATGDFSLEGCVELAWMMGLIRYERRRVCEGIDTGAGWVECESGQPIRDIDVKSKLEDRIREHTGIRILDPHDWDNPDPRLRDMLHEIGTEEDLPPFECSSQAGENFKARHGDAVEVLGDDGTTATVRVRRGATIFIPKALNTEYFVGAQVPTGWDAARYGVPSEILAQVSRPALYALVCTAEAFLSAGITDVYELYRYIHMSDVGNCIASGAGGSTAIRAFLERRMLGKEVQKDILSETFIGTAAAWVNLLLLSASGPLKTAAGTCATSLESLDTACDLITSGKSKICLAGGYDVFTRPVFYEFGEMNAIIDSAQDSRCGRTPREMSRPFTSTRNGFVLSEGIGVQVVTSASLALEMGLPIYGVVAMTHMAADKIGRSIPAPGKGILTAAKQANTRIPCLLMDPVLREKRIRTSIRNIERQGEADIESVKEEVSFREARGETVDVSETDSRINSIKQAVQLERKAILRELGHNYWRKDPGVSPITGALSVFGLGIDDLTFASLHGTATKLNDINECATLETQLRHLGRNPGNPIFTIAQKSVVGHGVGASGSWAVNGALQVMHSGIIPGNRNADDIDTRLQRFERLLLSNENIHLNPSEMKACCVTSFGFGQKGAQVLLVHPRYLFGAISENDYQVYREKQMKRGKVATRELDRGLHGEGMFKAKEHPPYGDDEAAFLLNPLARME